MILHFFTDTKDSDLAILKLENPLKFSAHIRPACLPDANFYPENDEDNVMGIVSGWGLVKDSNSDFSFLSISTGICNSNLD